MKYPYIVSKNGIWYPAGTEVPEDAVQKNSKTKPTGESAPEQDKPAGEQNVTEQNATGESAPEQDKPKRGRKSKEE